jgi:hypothetical protein
MRRRHDELVLEASRAIFVVLSNVRSPLARTPRLAWTSTDSAPRFRPAATFSAGGRPAQGKLRGLQFDIAKTKGQPQFVGTMNGL